MLSQQHTDTKSAPVYYEVSRFTDNKGIKEGSYTYNSNKIGVIVVAEGPHPLTLDHMVSFLENLVARKITHQIAAGDPLDGRLVYKGFFDITNQIECDRLLSKGYKISIKEVDAGLSSSAAKQFLIDIENTANKTVYQVSYLTFPEWKDFAADRFNPDTLRMLYEFYKSSKEQSVGQLGVNCTAGLGRSGVIALAFNLYEDAACSLEAGKTSELKQLCQARLDEMRKIRSGLVQGDAQFELAIDLAVGMRKIDKDLALKKEIMLRFDKMKKYADENIGKEDHKHAAVTELYNQYQPMLSAREIISADQLEAMRAALTGDQTKAVLGLHRNLRYLLGELVSAIVLLGVGYLVAAAIMRSRTGRFGLFSEPRTAGLAREIAECLPHPPVDLRKTA